MAADEQADAADPSPSPSTSQHDAVPIFLDTLDGRAARLVYYEVRKLNNLPNSLLDHNDATTAVHDRPTAIKRVVLPPKRDSDPRGRSSKRGAMAVDRRVFSPGIGRKQRVIPSGCGWR